MVKKLYLHKKALEANEESRKIREENSKASRERSAKKGARLVDEESKKLSHNWLRSWHKSGMSSYQPMLSHCKDCGVNYYLFKGRPSFCPKAKSEPKTET